MSDSWNVPSRINNCATSQCLSNSLRFRIRPSSKSAFGEGTRLVCTGASTSSLTFFNVSILSTFLPFGSGWTEKSSKNRLRFTRFFKRESKIPLAAFYFWEVPILIGIRRGILEYSFKNFFEKQKRPEQDELLAGALLRCIRSFCSGQYHILLRYRSKQTDIIL